MTPRQRINRWYRFARRHALKLALLTAVSGVLFVIFPSQSSAVTTVPTKMNFQGRLTDSSGNVKANGTYNMRLRLYTVSSGGSAVWSEDRLVSATQGVTVTNGLFSIKLGEVTSLPASLFASGELYLAVELPSPATATSASPSWTEGPMTPRNQMATSAYAYNSETLDGIDSTSFARTDANNTLTGTQTVNVASTAAFDIQNGSAVSVFKIDTSGSKVTVGTSDTTGTLFVLDDKTGAGDPTGIAGAMYYNSNASKFRCYQNGVWTDCIGGGGDVYLANSQTFTGNNTFSGTSTFNNTVTANTLSTAALDIQNGSAVSVLKVDTVNHRVGISTSAPTAKLHIDGTARVIGSELVTNGTFTGSATGWTLGDCASYGSNSVTVLYQDGICDDPSIQASVALTSGKRYKLTFDITTNGDNAYVYFNNNGGAITDDGPFSDGTHTVYFDSSFTGTDDMIFESWDWDDNTGWSIDNVSVQEIDTSGALLIKGYDGSTWMSLGSSINRNIAIGQQTMSANSGNDNVAYGAYSLQGNTTGSGNIAIGNYTLQGNTTGYSNTAIGAQSLMRNTTGFSNVANGTQSLYSNTTGNSNVANGAQSLYSNTTGYHNVANGALSLYSNTTGNGNIATGYQSLVSNTTGSNNVATGANSLLSNTTGYQNVANGYRSLESNTTGVQNVANGAFSLLLNTTGTGNVASGVSSLQSNTTGGDNVASGDNSMRLNTTGMQNVASGAYSLYSNTTGNANSALGIQSLYNNTTGSNNSALGTYAGYRDFNSTFFTLPDLQNASAIGAYAQVQASNSIVLGSVDQLTKVAIGSTVPLNTFSVSPLDYQTGTVTRTNGSATLTGTGTIWTSAMVGDAIVFADGTTNTVTGFTNATTITMGTTYTGTTDASPVRYRFHKVGLQVTSTGKIGVGVINPTADFQVKSSSSAAFDIQNSSGTSLLSVNASTPSVTVAADTTVAAGKSVTIVGGNTASRPASPTEGMIYYDTTTKQLLTYTNGKWQADRTDAVIVAASNSSQADKDAADYVSDGNTGAAADGDQVQINAALTAGSGKKVVLLAGTYVIDASISVPNNTTLAGTGMNTIVEIGGGSSLDVIVNADTTTGTGIVLRDFKLDGRTDLYPSAADSGVSLNGMGSGSGATAKVGAKIYNLYITRMNYAGVFAANSANTEISGITVKEVNYGVEINATNTTITNSSFQNNSDAGIYIGSGGENKVIGNTVSGAVYLGIYVGDSHSVVTGNRVQDSGDTGILVESQYSVINDNVITGSILYGILVDQSHNTISSNMLYDNGGATTNNAIYVDGSDNSIIGNHIEDDSCTTDCYAINIDGFGWDNYLADNTLGGGSINDIGTGTIYANQVDASGNLRLQPAGTVELQKNTNVTGTLQATGNITASSGTVTIGTTSVAGSLVISDGSSNTATIAVGNLGGNYTYTIPVTTANDTFCLVTLANCADGGVTSVGTYSTSNTAAGGAMISGSSIIFQDASATAPGMVGTGTQTFAGNKTFNGTLSVNDVSVAAGKSVTIVGGNTASRPASPTEGMIYYDSSTKQLLTYANGKWQADRSTSTKIVAASNSSQAIKDAADYVADGTGDQTEINAALTAAAGGKVYLTEGTFTLNAFISVPSNTTLTGSGAGTLITIPNGLDLNMSFISNSNVANTSGNSGITVSHLKLDGNDANNANSQGGIDLSAGYSGTTNLRDLTVSNVIFQNFSSDALYSEAHYSKFIHNTFESTDRYGMNLSLGKHNTISSNTFTNSISFAALLLSDTDHNLATGNVIHTATDYGIHLQTANYNTVTGNIISDAGGATTNHAIYIETADNNTITDNVISDTSATTTNRAISIVDAASGANYLADNTLGGGSINDAGTGTVYGGQVNSSGNYVVQPAGTIELMKNTTIQGGTATLGTSSVAGNLVISDGSSNTATISVGSLGGNYTYSIPVTTANDTFCLVTLANCAGGGGVSTVGALDGGTANANGATISGGTIYLQSASATNAGLVNTTTQTFAGNKTFSGDLAVQNVSLAAGKTITITGDTTANRPGSPTEGMIYYDTTTKKLEVYSNGKWQADRTEAVIVAASNSSQAEKDAADYVADGNTGAAADGDQVQINAALTAASGKKVILLAGTYVADATILIPNDTTLAGVGRGTVIELADLDATDNLIENSDTTNGTGVVIQDLQLDGRSDLNTAGTQYGIYMNALGASSGGGRRGGSFTNLVVTRFRTYGIYLQASAYNTLAHNHLHGGTRGLLMNYGFGNVVSGNKFENLTVTAMDVSGTGNLGGHTITGNTLFQNATGLILNQNNNTITGNTFTTNSTYGVTFLSAASNTLTGNNFVNSGGSTTNNAIHLTGSDSNTITGNNITDSSATTNNYAINVFDSTSDTNYLADNTLGGGSINDAGTGTVYGGQVNSSGNYVVQPAGTIELMKNTTIQGGTATLGTSSVAGNLVISDGSSNTATISVGSLGGNYTYSIPVTTANDTFCLQTLANCASGGGVSTVGALDGGTANSTGATISGSTIYLQSASATNPGLVNTTTQTFAGNKTFSGDLAVQNVSLAAGKTITIAGDTTANRPASPTEGMIYYDTTTKKLEIYSNGKWQADQTDAVLVAASNSSQADKDAADYVADGNGGGAGDGDQVQINSALTAATGKKVVLLAGTYVADATILVPNNTTLAGIGSGTLIELADLDAADNLIENSDTTTGTGISIRDLKLDGRNDLNTTGTQRGISVNGIGLSGRTGGSLENIVATRFRNAAIYVDGSTRLNIQNNTVSSSGDGIYVLGSSYIVVSANTVYSNGGSGLGIDTTDNSVITNNTLSSNTYGVFAYAATDNTISSNTFSNNTANGVALYSSNNNTLTGNAFKDNGGTTTNNAIYLDAADSNTITGNNITDSSATTNNYAINASNSTSDTNYLADNTLGGGSINDAGTGTIYANQLNASGQFINRSTGGFAIQGTAGTNLFSTAGTASVTIGTSDTTGTVFVLDTKTGAGDPTGIVGGMYYNSNAGRFLCYQVSAWKNCDDGGNATTIDGLDSTAFGQLSASNTWTGANTFNVLGANAFRIQNGSAVDVLKVDTVNQTVSMGNGTNTNNARLSIDGRGGVTWVAHTAAEANLWQSVAYGEGVFVAVSSTGTNRVMTSPDGITWTARAAAEANDWRSVTYGNGQFVAVSQDGTNRVMTSPDGITWTARAAAQANGWRSVTYGNGQFVAVSNSGANRVMTSPDGITWAAPSAIAANEWQSITYGNGLYVAVSSSGTNRVITSPDGTAWTTRAAAEANSWESVTYGNGQFVAVSQDGTNRVMTSPDGTTWTARAAAEANGWNTVTYGNGQFVAVSWSGANRVMTSPDGITWTARAAAEANSWDTVTYGNGQFVAVSTTGTNRVMTSSDIALSTQGQVQVNGDFAVGNGLFSVDTDGAGAVTILGNTGGKTEPWSPAANVLPSGRSYATSVAANGYVYMIGGFNSSYQSTVYYAKLNTDGTVGTWSTAANALPATRSDATSVVANGYVYVMGGYDGTYHDTVYYAKLNADGSVGTWRTSSNVLPGLRNNATSVVANGYVYVMGGFDGSARTDTVYYAKLNADGSIGAWSTSGNTLPAIRGTATSVTANGYVYVIGGRDASAAQDTVYYAKLNADGTVGTWSTAANALPSTRYDTTSVVANGYVYVMGGTNGPAHSTVYYAKLNADGTVGTWSTGANSLPATRYGATSVIANGYAYVLGGVNVGNHDTVYYSRLGGVVNVGGSIDLVGLQGHNLAEGGDGSAGSTGGSITAGNITGVGTLQIQGAAAFANTVSVAGDFNAGNGLFSVEADHTAVRIGSSTADSTGVVLVLDTKNTSGDPTGVAGAMYYNSSWGRFRCYENGAWQNCDTATRVNLSAATQAMSAGTDTYITGSMVPLPTGGFQAPTGTSQNGTMIRWKITMSKTAAGTAASTFNIRIGTNGTTADTARCTAFSTGAATAAVDWAEVTITAYATAGGTTTALNCAGTLTHRLTTTGFSTALGVQAYSTAASFDSSAANTKAGLSFTGGTSSVITIQKVEVTATNL